MAAKTLPDQTYLRECFDYNPEAGVLTWKIRPRHHFRTDRGWRTTNTRYAGKRAGYVREGDGAPRRYISLPGHSVPLARVIWKWAKGEDPSGEIDHKDTDGLNDIWNNLRDATRVQNQANTNGRRDKLLPKGVYQDFRKEPPVFVARITVQRKVIYISSHSTPEAAHTAYCVYAKKQYGEFHNPGHPRKTTV